MALLRATIVDSDGNPVLDATDNVTFTIKSGPGFVAGVGNGDPSCQEPSQVRLVSLTLWKKQLRKQAAMLLPITTSCDLLDN